MALYVDIKKEFPDFKLEVAFETDKGILGIIGASGAGKSMTLRCIAGLEKPGSGQIILNNRVLFDSEKGINVSIRNRKVGILFENYALFPHMTVEQNIGFGLDALTPVVRNLKVEQKLSMLQLDGLEKRYPYQISQGQKQRVALARALVVEPEVLLLDEPLSALDDHLREQTINHLIHLLAQYQGETLFVTHNIEEAYRVCEKLIVLSKGRVEACGDKKEIFKNPPSLDTAKITGCRNLSKARKVSEKLLKATDWGCIMELPSIPENVSYVGFRGHDIFLDSGREQHNIYNCWPSFTSETPFKVIVYLCIGKPASETGKYDIQWEMSKEAWQGLRDMALPWKIHINPNKLFCF